MGHRHFDDMCWTVIDDRYHDIAWKLRYGNPTKNELMLAATVMSNYARLVEIPYKDANARVREIRNGANQ